MRKSTTVISAALLASALSAQAMASDNPLLPSGAAPAQAAAPKAAIAAAGNGLTPFIEASTRFRLSGESDTAEFTFWASKAEAQAGGDVVLAYKNAVSVLPDTGLASVEINGKPAGDFRIGSPFDFTAQTFKAAPGMLRAGYNVVRLKVTQHHRVDCSLQASYELWTDVNPARSGFKPIDPGIVTDLADLAKAGRLENGATDLRIVTSAKNDAGLMNAASSVAQAVGLYLGRPDLAVSLSDRPGQGPGIDLYLMISGDAGVSVGPGGEPGRIALTFRAPSAAGLHDLLVATVKKEMMAGLRDLNARKRFADVTLDAGQTATLKDMGIRSETFSGRMMRTRFEMRMPADFYPADYGSVALKLSAATAPGLEPQSQMLVRVNDVVVNAFPFRDTDGQNFDEKLIELPLRAFRPGVNRVEMLAELPRASDQACAPDAREDDKPRYMLLDKTSISVPELARVTRLPDLGAMAGTAYPYGDGKAFPVYLDQATPQAAGAALTLLTRLAQSAQSPINADFRIGKPSGPIAGDALVLIGSSDSQEQNDAIGSAAPSSVSFEETGAIDIAATGGEDQLIAAFRQSASDADTELSWSSRFGAMADRLGARFKRWLNYQSETSGAPDLQNALVTIAQTASAGDGATTEIRANTPEDLAFGVQRLASSEIWPRLSGGAAAISSDAATLAALDSAAPRFSDVTEQSVGNYRRIAAAWLSDNFKIYVGLVIALIGVFAAWLGFVVQRKGTRSDA
ncbi:cellulose biosynthesis cyclic di-GMP-binding regulatory protein BcsB [Rhizobium sp. FKL33]|uniref:cellulose biosynthesis cyclic di-GMP-binding regulatory protein BcsB n=1 Tax=Rhizobium sp. FKL33 TaxID=2562307 RepID=UPI0010C06FB2|nr:cellulose biosynthesis cyclic di-GMP-binding regulatory protein BcsB [Rhizobium sp. FKL33]